MIEVFFAYLQMQTVCKCKRFVIQPNLFFCAIEIIKRIWKKDPKCKVLIVVPKNVILEDTWYKSLYEEGISIRDIGAFYGAVKEYCKITITNMQSITNMEIDEIFDCIIFDEIHNYCTPRLFKILKKEVLK